MSPTAGVACMMLCRCAQSCGRAWVSCCCWRLERVDRWPSPARTAVVDRARAELAEALEAADAEAEVAAPRDRSAGAAAVAARAAARRIRSGVLVVSPAPVPATSVAVPAALALLWMAERAARPDRAVRPAPAARRLARRCSPSIVHAPRRPIASPARTPPIAAVTGSSSASVRPSRRDFRRSRLNATRPTQHAAAPRNSRPPTTARGCPSTSRLA